MDARQRAEAEIERLSEVMADTVRRGFASPAPRRDEAPAPREEDRR